MRLFFMKKIFIAIFIFPIKLYQWCISPFFPASCRHTPTCSTYTADAMNEWGVLKGFWLGIKRLSKCHPWGTSGYDPVPKKNQLNCSQHEHSHYKIESI